jgi:hypothetical protein
MDRRIIVSVIVLLSVSGLAWWLLHEGSSSPIPEPVPATVATDAASGAGRTASTALKANSVNAAGPEAGAAATPQSGSDTNDSATAEGKHEAYVTARISELIDLGMDDQRSSLDTILSELNNREPRIREAAVEAAIQFGSRDAIPVLIDAAAQTDDPKEKTALLDAAEFLKLPTLTEVTAQKNQSQPAQTNGGH